MSIAAKQKFLKEIEQHSQSVLSASELSAFLDAISRSMSRYNVEEAYSDGSDSDTSDCLDAFLSAKRLEGRSEATVKHYEYVLTRFFNSLSTPLKDLTVFHFRSYLSAEKSRGIGDKTLEGYRSVFSSFFGWLHKENLIKENPCANLMPIKCQKKVLIPYSEVDLEKLKDNCGNARDKALVSFMLSTGCRISEICALNRNNIDFRSKECTVLGKGNKERVVFISDVAAMNLERYLSTRTDGSPALFAGRGTDRMTPGGVRRMLTIVGEKANVENVHPHRFRRTLATNLITRGMPIQEVATILGHDKLDTTMKYVYLDKTNVHNSYSRYS